jgi:hypothetical protein
MNAQGSGELPDQLHFLDLLPDDNHGRSGGARRGLPGGSASGPDITLRRAVTGDGFRRAFPDRQV